MTRNVARLLNRPCALSHRSLLLSSTATKRFIQHQTPQEALKDEEANKILRVADQHALRRTNREAAKFISSIETLQKAIDALPTTITNPDIEGQYIVASTREKVQDTPIKAQAVIDAVENVQANLRDLTVQGYDKKKDSKDLVREFEEEIKGWDDDKKREELKTMQLQEEGRIVRLNEASQLLLKFVNEKLRAKGKSKVLDFQSPKGSAVKSPAEKRVFIPEPEPEPDHIKPRVTIDQKPARQQQRDLFDIQAQLEQSVTGPSGKNKG